MHPAFIATAIALVFSLHTAQAAEAHAATVPGAGMVHASLGGLPAVQNTASRKDAINAAPGQQGKPQAANATTDSAAGDGEHEPSTAMLLAALLVLMAGIALRRRDPAQP